MPNPTSQVEYTLEDPTHHYDSGTGAFTGEVSAEMLEVGEGTSCSPFARSLKAPGDPTLAPERTEKLTFQDLKPEM